MPGKNSHCSDNAWNSLSIVYQLSSPDIASTARLKMSPLNPGWVTIRKTCSGEKKEEKLRIAVVIWQKKSRGFESFLV